MVINCGHSCHWAGQSDCSIIKNKKVLRKINRNRKPGGSPRLVIHCNCCHCCHWCCCCQWFYVDVVVDVVVVEYFECWWLLGLWECVQDVMSNVAIETSTLVLLADVGLNSLVSKRFLWWIFSGSSSEIAIEDAWCSASPWSRHDCGGSYGISESTAALVKWKAPAPIKGVGNNLVNGVGCHIRILISRTLSIDKSHPRIWYR